ncbi:F5/8_type C domain-containing protein [Hexamita inflata]|uniref:F5/8 type C domain-containing protein n=1 Tax=Hexamita inflata TaxID=28002 RepID=A0AA86UR84_9EUKA|nr:F5/8 type C domain-containing protein [Hexamita inflata]
MFPITKNEILKYYYSYLPLQSNGRASSRNQQFSKSIQVEQRARICYTNCFRLLSQQRIKVWSLLTTYLDGTENKWTPINPNKITGQYIEFDFHKQILIGKIITRGHPYKHSIQQCWVTKYRVEYFKDGEWCQGGEFEGNADDYTKVFRRICLITNKLRIYPIEFFGTISFKVDVAVSEDLNQVDNIPDVIEDNKQAITESYNCKMIEIYEKCIQIFKVSVNLQNLPFTERQNVTSQKFGDDDCIKTTEDNILLIFCYNKEAVLDQLKLVDTELKITVEECRSIAREQFQIGTDQLQELNFLEQFKLTNLTLQGCTKINFIQNPGVQFFEASYCDVTSCEGIQNWKQLRELNLSINKLENIQFLKELTNLQGLILNDNKISNIDILGWLKNLTILNLENNDISNIDILQQCSNLSILKLGDNKISNIESLSKLNLKVLLLNNNSITDVRHLQDLSELMELNLRSNYIKEFSIIEKHTNFKNYNLDSQK